MIKFIKGNIFDSDCSVLVNPVNCEGVMGAGLALEFRLRYPQMFSKYQALCGNRLLTIGKLWLYIGTDVKILNFPTKTSWKASTKAIYLETGLKKFVDHYHSKGIYSIAFPLLGAGKGGLSPSLSKKLMEQYLTDLPICVEVYEYDPSAKDKFYEAIKANVIESCQEDLLKETKISAKTLEKIIFSMRDDNICQLNQLIQTPGVGIRSMEKLVYYALNKNKNIQTELF